jgi:sugar lactone lactonase YvrE
MDRGPGPCPASVPDQPLDLYDLGRLAPETFAVGEDGTLWLVDSDSRRLYRMTLVGGAYKPVASAPLSTLAGPEGILRGLSVEGDALWLLSADPSGRAVLRRMPLDRLAWRAAS